MWSRAEGEELSTKDARSNNQGEELSTKVVTLKQGDVPFSGNIHPYRSLRGHTAAAWETQGCYDVWSRAEGEELSTKDAGLTTRERGSRLRLSYWSKRVCLACKGVGVLQGCYSVWSSNRGEEFSTKVASDNSQGGVTLYEGCDTGAMGFAHREERVTCGDSILHELAFGSLPPEA